MSITTLREALGRRTFEPFRIRLSSGDVYEVRHPEAALLLKGGIYIGLPADNAPTENGDLPDRAVYCSLLHVAAIETLASA